MYKVGRSRTPQGVRGLKLVSVSIVSGVARRTPQGVRGLKLHRQTVSPLHNSRTPQGVRGLKPPHPDSQRPLNVSHSARSAWIETTIVKPDLIS